MEKSEVKVFVQGFVRIFEETQQGGIGIDPLVEKINIGYEQNVLGNCVHALVMKRISLEGGVVFLFAYLVHMNIHASKYPIFMFLQQLIAELSAINEGKM
jgi:hypothetical protein